MRLSQRTAALPTRAAPGAVVLAASRLDVRIDGVPVLADVDLEIRAGEILALVGPNGAGKSTLLAALAGDLPPVSGDITLGGRLIEAWSPVELAMRRAMLVQRVDVSFPFTVREIVEMGRAPWRGTPASADDDRAVATAMAATDVAGLESRRFNSLSGGERARAALARVLAQQTGVLLLDEPTAALDLHHQELVMAIAQDRARRGDAVVVVVHDLNLAAAHAERVAVLAAGRLVADGRPAEVFAAELLTDVYRHEVEVLSHPRTAAPLVLPRRG